MFAMSVLTGTPLHGQCTATAGDLGDCVNGTVCDSDKTCSKYSFISFDTQAGMANA